MKGMIIHTTYKKKTQVMSLGLFVYVLSNVTKACAGT